MAARVTQAMLERALGGASQLLQLVDRDRTGALAATSCQAFIAEILDEGYGEVNGYVSLAADLADPSLQTAPMLIRYELAVDVYLTWFKGSSNAAIPDKVVAEYEKAQAELYKIGQRQKGLGLIVRPVGSQPVQHVTKAPTEAWFNADSPRRRFDGWS